MEKLSLKSYVWKCVIGLELAFVGCLIYAVILTGASKEVMIKFLEYIPGFVWGSVAGFIFGAFWIGVMALVFGSYMVWMHNSSLINK